MKNDLGFRALYPITAGWSGDSKYCAAGSDGKRYFLRVAPHEKAERAKKSFELQKKMYSLGVPMCEPLECGECEEGFYTLQSWVDGVNAEDAVPPMPEADQYELGCEAGAILKKIHSIPATENAPGWEPRFNAKMDRKIKNYIECPVKVEGAECFIEYIERSRDLLRSRPQCFQHGDYHIGNMMIENGKPVIIDFDRYDFGDPWEEFNRIVWCAQKAPRFACGMIDGYFGGSVPPLFWQLLALYISSNTFSSIPWAIHFGDDEIRIMTEQTKEIMSWYDDMRRVVPSWYGG